MSLPYNPSDHYWIVAGDEANVFSSASGDYVQASDATYQAWLSAGGLPTRIASDAELGEVLAPLSLRPANASVLDGYKDSQARNITIKVAAKVLFNHENRIRALEGKQPATTAQFKNALKDLM